MNDRTPSKPLDLIASADLATPMAIRVAATLRLADLISSGRTRLAELATAAGAEPDALRRLLRFLTCRGLFTEPERDVYAMNPPAYLLRSNAPMGLHPWLDLQGMAGRMELTFTGLLDSVRTGAPVYEGLYGQPFWDDIGADPDRVASFDALMAANAEWFGPGVADGYDWASVRHVVDVGGGRGELLRRLLTAHPGLRGTLVDQPDTAAKARELIRAAGLDGRCDVVEGSFFDPLPDGGDVYVLANVLHDWSDARALTILRRCARAGGERGRVLLVEWILGAGPAEEQATLVDLRMLTLMGGRERTLDEVGGLAAAAGLSVRSATPTAAGLVLVECVSSDAAEPVPDRSFPADRSVPAAGAGDPP
ncbi:methyltransferase [Streptomyces sp. NPDC001985]|uniref:methyltransferase n=1 Tax=Streptomyces sp. NPDC001985 TaxID=3154406 RepID=UPI003325B24B